MLPRYLENMMGVGVQKKPKTGKCILWFTIKASLWRRILQGDLSKTDFKNRFIRVWMKDTDEEQNTEL